MESWERREMSLMEKRRPMADGDEENKSSHYYYIINMINSARIRRPERAADTQERDQTFGN